jgi:hypothetical protein
MHRCPFFDDYPDIFVIAVVVLAFNHIDSCGMFKQQHYPLPTMITLMIVIMFVEECR